MKSFYSFILFFFITSLINSQSNITNTLGTGGVFYIKDVSTNYLTLTQSTGEVNILSTLRLENTTGPSLGIIFKGADRFLHNYQASGTNGYNTFLGINSGNFTMSGSGPQASYNTGIGFTLYNLTTGYENTAMGFNSLAFNTTGYFNTAVGVQSLNFNTDGYQNTALGLNSLYSNTIGINNTALGVNSLFSNIDGVNNTAVGFQSLYSNTFGSFNTAVGIHSLYSNIFGGNNTAVGYWSLYNNTGGNNTAVGYGSLISNINGGNNTAVGLYSLSSNIDGVNNTTVGYYAGSTIITGSNLTLIGYNAQPTSSSATDQITLGNDQITSLRCHVTTITALSDARDKKNISDLSLGLDFITKIKPRQFNWDKREWYDDNISDGSKMKESPTAGFIAQELDEVQTTQNAEWLNLVLKDNPEKWEATPGNLLPIMVKAIQELKEENDQLKAQLEDVTEIKEQLAEIKILKEELNEHIKILKTNNKTKVVEFSSVSNLEWKK